MDAYDINLYKGSSAIYKGEGVQGHVDQFYPYMTSAGTYTIKVRSAPSGDSQKDYADSSDWTESDELYIAKESVSNGSGKIDYNNTNSAANNSTSQVGWIRMGAAGGTAIRTEPSRRIPGCWSTISGICLTKTAGC